jgi:hypothetical protein
VSLQLWSGYEDARTDLTTSLQRAQPLSRYSAVDESDWLLAMCDAWGALVEVIGFYQQRILAEAFLSTAEQTSSKELIYHSLGHAFPANATATTALAYHLDAGVAGVEAVNRAGSAGGTGMSPQTVATLAAQTGAGTPADAPADGSSLPPPATPAAAAPGLTSVGTPAGITPGTTSSAASPLTLGKASDIPPAAQVRAVPSASCRAQTFVTLAPLGAYVGASRLAVQTQTTARPPALTPASTQLELAGTKTGLAVGQPLLITAAPTGEGPPLRWIRLLTEVKPDVQRGSTRVGWEEPIGSLSGEPAPTDSTETVVLGFARSSSLAGANAPEWSAQPAARALQASTESGRPIPIRGGVASSGDDGSTWTLSAAGLPVGVDLTAVAAYGDVTLVAAGSSGILRSVGGQPFAAASIAGGGRRAVGFLGGTSDRMLAGAAGGIVYESLDQGQTWSPVTGGPAEVTSTPDGGRQVSTFQLPSSVVRSVLTDPSDGTLLAGTDSGPYTYSGGRWQPADPAIPAQPAVFALLARADGTLAAGTSAGLFLRSDGAWQTSGLTDPVHALAEASGSLYAATGDGVYAESGDAWEPAGSAWPAGLPVHALLAAGTTLLAATEDGIYRGTSGPSLSWSRCDDALAFAVPAATLPPAAGATAPIPPPATLVAVFAEFGIELGASALLSGSTAGYALQDGPDSYFLTPDAADDGWQVLVRAALPDAAGLAQAAGGPILAVGTAATAVANQWPGFAVAGSTVELAPPLRTVPSGGPAIIEQRTATPSATVLDITGVEQDSAIRAGRTTSLTRLHFSQDLPAGEFPRRASTVWTGAGVLPLFDPPSAAVQELMGTDIDLAAPLTAPLEPGRLAAITGSPPGLTVAPLGGLIRVATSEAMPENLGPPQADLTGVAVGADGDVYVSGVEGVFSLGTADGAAGAGAPEVMRAGWPRGGSAGVAVAGSIVLAGSAGGVLQLSAAPPRTWSVAVAGAEVTALTGDGTRVVAGFADGSMRQAADAAQQPAVWTDLPSLTPAPTELAVSSSAVYAANANGVFELSGSSWTALTGGAVPGPVAALQIDAGGTLWAATSTGVSSYAGATAGWRRDPTVAAQVQALCLQPSGTMTLAGARAVATLQGAEWNEVSSPPGTTIAAMAGAPDGSLWLAAQASVPARPQSGTGEFDIRHLFVLGGVDVTTRDLETLAQGGVPDTLLAALSDAGEALDVSHAITTPATPGCWLISSAGRLYIVVQRGTTDQPTLEVYRNQAVVYPTGPPANNGTAQKWTVLAGGVLASLVAQESTVVRLPAGTDAPAWVEMATVAPPPAGAEAAPMTLGATSTVTLKDPLSYVYDAGTVQVNLNMVPAAAGQSVSVPIGSGDAQQAHQTFATPSPVAAIAAQPETSSGTPATSLRIYVDGQPWTEVPSLQEAASDDFAYLVRHNADGSAGVSFGDGIHGSRLPTGQSNVVATYVQGGGADSEVAAGALIQALDRPQLVSQVHNPSPALLPPMPPEDEARLSAVRRLDRTVTVEDYEEQAAAQPGVRSARVDVLAGPLGRAMVISVASADDAPSDLLDQLADTMGEVSASGLPVRFVDAQVVQVELTIDVISDRPATAIEPAVRNALSGLPARRPGDPLYAAQVLTAATGVAGVIAAAISDWERLGDPTSTATALHAAGASWAADSPAPTGAELLTIDGALHHMQLNIHAPNA